MLSRVLEPEVMDTAAEALDYDAMDHATVNATFVADLLAEYPEAALSTDEGLDVLDIGTGTAQIPIALCRLCPDVRVVAIDLAAAMLHLGRTNVEVAGLTSQIRLDRIDAKQLPYSDCQFQLVISNSIVHHIPSPHDAMAEAVRVLAPGGLIFVRDLLRPVDDATVNHLVATYAAGANDHQRQLFDQSLRAALNLDEARALAESIGLAPNCVTQTSDRHWTLAARRD
ncbi:MAG TPA: class I SAM-dependent methyltransferase [Pirellulales bacterium]